jgi:hypothetical protein
MAIFKTNKSSRIKRPAFFLPKSNKKYASLDEDESSCVSTTTKKQAQQVERPTTTTNNDRSGSKPAPRVKFQTKVSVREVVRAKDLAEDPNELWYHASEYNRISQKALSIVRAVDKGSYQVEGKRLCARGLERHLTSSKNAADLIRNEAWSSVFEEQSMQLAAGGKYNDERISSICMEFSIEAQMEAHERGLSDAREAEKCILKKSSRRYLASRDNRAS